MRGRGRLAGALLAGGAAGALVVLLLSRRRSRTDADALSRAVDEGVAAAGAAARTSEPAWIRVDTGTDEAGESNLHAAEAVGAPSPTP